MARLNIARLNEPDFISSPYQEFKLALHHRPRTRPTGCTPGHLALTSEFKVSYDDDSLKRDRAHSNVPTLASADGTLLPGARIFTHTATLAE